MARNHYANGAKARISGPQDVRLGIFNPWAARDLVDQSGQMTPPEQSSEGAVNDALRDIPTQYHLTPIEQVVAVTAVLLVLEGGGGQPRSPIDAGQLAA